MSLLPRQSDAELLAMHQQRTGRVLNGVELGPESPLRAPRDSRVAPEAARPKAKPARSLEHLEQVALFDWIDEHVAVIPELALCYAVPNGGKRSIAAAGKLKAEGVKPGVPDVVLPCPSKDGRFHALYIEMKQPGGSLTPAQSEWHFGLTRHGNRVAICATWEAARDEILHHLGH